MSKKFKSNLSDSSGKRVLEENDQKRVEKGEDMYGYGEQKTKLNLTVTPTAKKILKAASTKQKLSQSEFVERWLRDEVNKTLD